jgi:hypothetical protein
MNGTAEMDVGVVLRRRPGVTRWQREVWSLAAVIPHAPPAEGRVLREAGEVVEVHAATLPVDLHRKETEGYVENLQSALPSVWVALRGGTGAPTVWKVTVSAVEAARFEIDGEDRIERVALPPPMLDWLRAFVAAHHAPEPFVKRRRDKRREGEAQDGIGDARIAQGADVWRTPSSLRERK